MPPHRRLRRNCLRARPRVQDQLGGPRHASHAEQLRKNATLADEMVDGDLEEAGEDDEEEGAPAAAEDSLRPTCSRRRCARGTATSTSRIFKPAPPQAQRPPPPSLRRCPLRHRSHRHTSHPSWSARRQPGELRPLRSSPLASVGKSSRYPR